MKTALIRIEKAVNGTYRVKLMADPAGAPLAEGLISDQLSFAGQRQNSSVYRDLILTQEGSSQDFVEVGRDLFDLALRGPVFTAWLQLAGQHGQLRTLLDIHEDLALLPWELLCRDAGPDVERLFLDKERTFARARNYLAGDPPAPYPWPVRVLVVIGASGIDADRIGAGAEVKSIEEAVRAKNRSNVHALDVEVLWHLEDRPAFLNRYRALCPHVLHFIGHGGTDPATKKPCLRFDPPGRNPWYWTTEYITNDLKSWRPRFVFLNACRSAAASGINEQTDARSVADAFLAAGVPAALGMQADVRGALAGPFAAELYEALASGVSLDAALAEARQAAIKPVYGLTRRDWALPVLTLAAPPEHVLPLKPRVPAHVLNKIELCPAFQEVQKDFVNRKLERRQFHTSLSAPLPEDRTWNLLVIRGPSSAGKSAFVHWCMAGHVRQGLNVRYMEVADASDKKWLDILQQIRKGDANKALLSLIHEPLPEAAFTDFNQIALDPIAAKRTDYAARVFTAFRKGLAQTAADTPLLLVLDHFTEGTGGLTASEFLAFLRPHLIDHIAIGNVALVRMVLVLTDREYDDYQLSKVKSLFSEITIADRPRGEFARLAFEFFQYNGLGEKKGLEGWIQMKVEELSDPWRMSELREFCNYSKKALGIK